MFTVRRSKERGHFDHGWLDTYHTFSFSDYYDPRHMHFRALRVMNEDRVAPGTGFGKHPHREMEIVTYILSGALTHRDSLGTASALRAGELQRMTAGTGIIHGEANDSPTEPVHLYQIWLLPETKGLEPSYEQRAFEESEKRGRLRLVASRDGQEGSLTIRQDVALYLATLEAGETVAHRLAPGRHAWLQVLRGRVAAGGHDLDEGDGLAVSAEAGLQIEGVGSSEILLFDLA